MKKIILRCIRLYQYYLSLDTGILKFILGTGRVCRFHPTCSQYTYEAIERYGIITGLSRGFKRILRCHPGSQGGYDPVD